MTVNQLIERLKKISGDGNGESPVEVRNPAGDTSDLESIRVFEGTVYLED